MSGLLRPTDMNPSCCAQRLNVYMLGSIEIGYGLLTMKWILIPSQKRSHLRPTIGVLLLLICSAVALSAAPALMPEGYSWVAHTVSESAAQGLKGAWMARLGFLLFGMAVIWLATASETMWARGVVWMHLAFAVLMVATAAFSHKPWVAGVPFDPFEDHLHSFTATAMGFAFALGVLLRFLQQWGQGRRGRVLDMIALLSATFIPMLMLFQSDIAGLVQRLMFLVAFVWYGKEALDLYGSSITQQGTAPGGESVAPHWRR